MNSLRYRYAQYKHNNAVAALKLFRPSNIVKAFLSPILDGLRTILVYLNFFGGANR